MAVAWTVASAEILPRHGEFEGVYHRDRWGVGHFNYFLVSPALHDRLSELENRRIRLQVLQADQPMNPGPAIIRSIGNATEIDQSSLEVELRTEVRWNRNQREIEATFFLRNRSDTPIDVSLHDVVLRIRSGADQSDLAPDYLFKEYTRGQVRTKEQSLQWLNNRIALANESFEQGHHLKIRPKERFPIVARLPISTGEHEFQFEGRPFSGVPQSTWFPITVSEEAPGGTARRPSQLKIGDVQWKMSTNPFDVPVLRLSFTLAGPAVNGRMAAVCTERGRVLLAGTIAGIDEAGSVRKLETDPCYDCSNQGEPWQLKAIPPGGFSTEIDIRERQVLLGRANLSKVKLELLTDEGLEAFTVPGPPMGIIRSEQTSKP